MLQVGSPASESGLQARELTMSSDSVRVTMDYQGLEVLDQGDIIWFWIGPHHEYDRLLRHMYSFGKSGSLT